MKKNIITTIILIILTMVLGLFVLAADDPLGPNSITRESSSRLNETLYPSVEVNATAGNITVLTIDAISSTRVWQGFVGNVSGTITLEDVNGHVLYNWSATEPQGEVYASTASTITWSNIKCFDHDAVDGSPNSTTIEASFNVPTESAEGIDETFTLTSHPAIYPAGVTIAENTCPSTYTFVNSAAQSSDFPQLLLDDGTNLVFTAIIESKEDNTYGSKTGYNGQNYDFQMLVMDDGYGSDVAVTPYYFWVQIM